MEKDYIIFYLGIRLREYFKDLPIELFYELCKDHARKLINSGMTLEKYEEELTKLFRKGSEN